MLKQEVAELKKRFKIDKNNINRVCGCYVSAEKEKIVTFSENFLSLEEDETFKFLDIAKKSLGGKIGNNLLDMEFPLKAEEEGGQQANLLALKKSALKNDDLLDAFYDFVIEKYEYPENYLILLFYDVYDVPKKGKDKANQGESEDVYDYVLCALCPVSTAKSTLGYLTEENKIGLVTGSWVVKAPDTAILFPAFNDRATDLHSALFFTKNTMEPHMEVMEEILGCKAVSTSDMNKDMFNTIIEQSIQKTNNEEEVADKILMVHNALHDYLEEHGGGSHADTAEYDLIELSKDTLKEILEDIDFDTDAIADVMSGFDDMFGDTTLYMSKIVDEKLLKKFGWKLELLDLRKQVQSLKKKDN